MVLLIIFKIQFKFLAHISIAARVVCVFFCVLVFVRADKSATYLLHNWHLSVTCGVGRWQLATGSWQWVESGKHAWIVIEPQLTWAVCQGRTGNRAFPKGRSASASAIDIFSPSSSFFMSGRTFDFMTYLSISNLMTSCSLCWSPRRKPNSAQNMFN